MAEPSDTTLAERARALEAQLPNEALPEAPRPAEGVAQEEPAEAWLAQDAPAYVSLTEPLEPPPSILKHRVVPTFMVLLGVGIAGMWTADIAGGRFADQGGFFAWREGENLLWPHLLAEGLTAAGLIAGGTGLYLHKDWGVSVSLLALGALSYTAINSSGWVLAEDDRLPYGVPMWAGLAGGMVSLAILLD